LDDFSIGPIVRVFSLIAATIVLAATSPRDQTATDHLPACVTEVTGGTDAARLQRCDHERSRYHH